MILNAGGKVVMKCWNAIPDHYPNVKLHEYVIMPNHIHGILELTPNTTENHFKNPDHDDLHSGIPHAGKSHVGVQYFEPLQHNQPHGETGRERSIPGKRRNKYQHIIPGSLGSIVRGFEIGVTKWFRQNTDIHNVWHRNFHDVIIRSSTAFGRITTYIRNNPRNWDNDMFRK
jgi:hypothetical protein